MDDVTQLYGAATLVVIVISVLVRMVSGASASELLQSRFYEIPTLRSIIVSLGLGLWLATLYAGGISLEQTWLYFDRGLPGSGQAAGIAVGGCGGLLLSAILYWRIAVNVGEYRPSPDIREADIQAGIDATDISRLGKERFPEKIQFGDSVCITARRWLVTLGILTLSLFAGSFTDSGQQYKLHSVREQVEQFLQDSLPQISMQIAQVLTTTLLLSSGLLLLFNSSYTVLRFPITVVLAFLLSGGLIASCLTTEVSVETLRWVVVGCLAAWTIRWGHDLYRASDFRRTTAILQPVRDHIRQAVPFLQRLSDYPDCQLEEPESDTIRHRVADGCQNVEDADPLVTPFLARFLSEVRANFCQMNAAMLRFLTVRRGVELSAGLGTSRVLQHPIVPVWDEQRFPLRPPRGFTDFRDPLALGSQWDIVKTCLSCGGQGKVNCTSCGGRGRRQEAESHTVYTGGQSQQRTRYVERMCTSCSGSGRQQCSSCSGYGRICQSQTLVTTWDRYLPTETAPSTRMSHLVEDAEERVYFRRPLIEDRQEIEAADETDDLHPDTISAMTMAADRVQSVLSDQVERVQSLQNGRVYRADFQVTAFHVIRIGFRGLHGGHGWFFGRRPEFYFPSLPLSWGKIAAVIFVWPFIWWSGRRLATAIRESVVSLLA